MSDFVYTPLSDDERRKAMTLIVRTPEMRNYLIAAKGRRRSRELLRALLKLPLAPLTAIFGAHATVSGQPVDADYFLRSGKPGTEWMTWVLGCIVREFGDLDKGAAWLKESAK